MAPYKASRLLASMPSSLLSLSAFSTLLLLSFPTATTAFDCKEIGASGQRFNFKELGGPRTVHWDQPADYENQEQFKWNFTLDICNNLERPTDSKKEEECHHGTRICAKRERLDLEVEGNSTITPIEIAGTYTTNNGRKIDAQFQLLRDSKSNSDAAREGVRAELHGGRYPFDDKKRGINQRAIIEFVCDKDRTGTEDGSGNDEKKPEGDGNGDKKEDKKEERLSTRESKCEDNDKSLRFCGYELDNLAKDQKVKTLRLEWRTKYACENAVDNTSSSHWGFFTWFIIILFLATAAYLIFGSWLNYNRYGARGWDLLPHGDTIRDVPYILKDFARNAKNTLSGSGNRGGYSAV